MFKIMIAGIAALSLTLASATPSYALDREEVGKLLIGLAAIAALNAAIENNNRRDEQKDTPVQRGIDRSNDWAGLGRGNSSHSQSVVPYVCLQTIETRFGAYRLFGERCLERNYRYVNSLPERCAVRLYTANGPARGYDPLCLRDEGYVSDRRD